jgi:hypothetical protein
MEVYGVDGVPPPGRPDKPARDTAGPRGDTDLSGSIFRASPADEAASLAVQRLLIRLLMHDSSLATEVVGRERAFSSDVMLRIYTNIAALEKEAREQGSGTGVEVSALADTLDEGDRNTLEVIMHDVLVTDDPKQQLADCIAQLDLIEMHAHEKNILEALKVTTGDEEEVARLMSELVKVQSRIRTLKER